MDLIKVTKKRRNLGLEILHVIFNIALVVVIFASIWLFDDNFPSVALVLVLLSKWRMLAVRPRYWWANFLSSLPDLLLGVSVVILMWRAPIIASLDGSYALATQIALSVFYGVWLILLKPQHKKHYVLIQAGLSQFISICALFSVGYLLPVWLVIFITFIVGFAAARQALGLFEEHHKAFLSSIWGVVLAEIAFIAWHWTIAYRIMDGLHVPAFAIISALLGFAVTAAYESYQKHDRLLWKDIKLPSIFSSLAIMIIVILFNNL